MSHPWAAKLSLVESGLSPRPKDYIVDADILTAPHRSSAISILSDTFRQPPFGSLLLISGGITSSSNSNVKLSSAVNSPSSGLVKTNSTLSFPLWSFASVTDTSLIRRFTFRVDGILRQSTGQLLVSGKDQTNRAVNGVIGEVVPGEKLTVEPEPLGFS